MIVATLLLAFALRVYGLTAESLWIDEGYSISLAGHGLSDIVKGTIADQHPPLYYTLLHLWQRLGHTIFHVRYLSVLIGFLGLCVAFLTARSLFGPRIGASALFWLTIAPMHVWYCQETRMYILLALLTTLSVYFFWRLAEGGRSWIGYTIVTVLALYTHNYAIFVLAVENALVVLWVLRKSAHTTFLHRWVRVQLVTACLYSVWIPVVIDQARHHQMRWLASPDLATLRGTLNWLLLGQSGAKPPGAGPVLLVVMVLIAIWMPKTRLRSTVLVLGWFALPLTLAYILSQRYPIFQAKQFLIALPALTAVVAVAIGRLGKWSRLLLAGVLLMYNASGLLDQGLAESKHEWREVAAYLTSQMIDGDGLYLNPAASILVLDVYLSDDIPHDGYPPGYDVIRGGWEGDIVDAATPDLVLAPLAAQYRRIWLVEFGPAFWDPEAHLAQWLEDHGRLADEREYSGIRVRLFDLNG